MPRLLQEALRVERKAQSKRSQPQEIQATLLSKREYGPSQFDSSALFGFITVVRHVRGEGVKPIARELGVDREPVKRWLRLGASQPRRQQRRECQLDRFAEFIERCAPKVGLNSVVLYRELQALGFSGGPMQRLRVSAIARRQRQLSILRWTNVISNGWQTAQARLTLQLVQKIGQSGSGSGRARAGRPALRSWR